MTQDDEETMIRQRDVVAALSNHGLLINWQRRTFFQNEIDYLYCTISKNYVRPSEADQASAYPSNRYQIKYSEKHAQIATPLTYLTPFRIYGKEKESVFTMLVVRQRWLPPNTPVTNSNSQLSIIGTEVQQQSSA
ncbi:hypothetical protein PV327_005190 [Microctonus hyperodae]|uniref:Uncharacterized protein n=1 Tax=Microctonus hyperodae TaxID=165561 RepID=A0AA39KZB2_MICHY|nr:hypothetical protein PV327_005190 [Microctonus hyperodae]